jgi:hypothetical protein
MAWQYDDSEPLVNNKSLSFAEQEILFPPFTVTAMLLTQFRLCCARCMTLRRSYLVSMRVEMGVARIRNMGKCNSNVVGKILLRGMGKRGVDCRLFK